MNDSPFAKRSTPDTRAALASLASMSLMSSIMGLDLRSHLPSSQYSYGKRNSLPRKVRAKKRHLRQIAKASKRRNRAA